MYRQPVSLPGSMRCLAFATIVLATVGSESLRAQARTDTMVVRGTVRDATKGTVLSGARLRFDALNRGAMADDAGRFEFVGIPIGTHVLTVEQYGYWPIEATVDAGSEVPVSIHLELDPRPMMLEGLTVVADRLELMESRLRSRRSAAATSSRAFEQERLVRSPATNMFDFLSLEAFLEPFPCEGGHAGSWCVMRRGRSVEPTVYIDEAPLIGGLDYLGTYPPHELHLVEVYSQGREIRAYTHHFMERMARHPIVLFPIGVGR